MTQRAIFLLTTLFLFLWSADVLSQSGKRYKGKTRTSKREITKRQQAAQKKQAAETPFAPTQSTVTQQKDLRDDYIWKSQTAGIVYPKAGNISILEPSKYAVTPKLQLESVLPMLYHVPNIFGKYQWFNARNWMVASRHGIYSATNGLRSFQNAQKYQYVDSAAMIPFILSLKNEIIVSRPYSKAYGCNGRQPYLVLSASLGVDFGIPLDDNGLDEMSRHFLTNRSPALIAEGWVANLMARADYQINPSLLTGASLKYFNGTFTGNHALEQKAWLETLLSSNIGISVGYALSWANYSTSHNLSLIPLFDVCYYFGKKKGAEKGLFKKKMF